MASSDNLVSEVVFFEYKLRKAKQAFPLQDRR